LAESIEEESNSEDSEFDEDDNFGNPIFQQKRRSSKELNNSSERLERNKLVSRSAAETPWTE
jgi:hypothetical protein